MELSDSDKTELDSILKDIDIIARGEFPPAFEEKKICNKCAYHDLCFIKGGFYGTKFLCI